MILTTAGTATLNVGLAFPIGLGLHYAIRNLTKSKNHSSKKPIQPIFGLGIPEMVILLFIVVTI